MPGPRQVLTRDEFEQICNVLLGLSPLAQPDVFASPVLIPLGRQATCTLTFKGKIGADEWDALLAHIAFYKQWYKEALQIGMSPSEMIDEIMRRLDERAPLTPSPPPTQENAG